MMSARLTGQRALHWLLARPGAARATELLLLATGRRWPASRPVRSLTWHLWRAMGESGHERVRTATVPGGLRLFLTLGDYNWARIYFRGSGTGKRRWLYEAETTRFVLRWLRPGDVFIDAGANVGYFSVVAAGLVGPTGAIHAFEPNPIVASLLRRTVDLNGVGEVVRVEETALSSTTGSTTLHLIDDPLHMGAASIVGTHLSSPERSLVVATTSLDRYLRECAVDHVRLIKIDVEGAEMEVIRGAESLLRNGQSDALLCEFQPSFFAHSADAWHELIGHLGDRGYEAFGLDESGALLPSDGTMPTWGWGNVCFLRADLSHETAAAVPAFAEVARSATWHGR